MECGLRSLFGLVLLLGTAFALWAASTPTGWKSYQGNFFAIAYPADFTARPPMPADDDRANTDYAFFRAPDGTVEFAVYAPLHYGDAKQLLPNPKTETLVSTRTETKVEKHGAASSNTTYRWQTVRAKDGRYTRAILDIESMSDGRLVYSFQYANPKAYRAYVDQYNTFKTTLVRYGDGNPDLEE